MASIIAELDLPLRHGILLTAQVVLFLWMRYVVALGTPGLSRFVRAAPLLPVIVLLSVLFDIDRPEEFFMALYCNVNFLWLSLFKILAFCLNRGQLVKSQESGSVAAFALCLLSGVTLAFDEKQIQNDKGKAYRDAEFHVIRFSKMGRLQEAGRILLRIFAKVGLLFLMEKGFYTFVESGQLFMKDFCLAWFLYGTTSMTQDVTSLFILLAMNLKTAPCFDAPWLAQSMQEFWSRRYNMVFAITLRDLVYNPITEGRWIHGPLYYQKVSAPPMRRAVGNLVTFVMSGVMHGVLLLYGYSLESFPIYFTLFFVACAFVIIGEGLVKALIKQAGMHDHIAQLVPNWIYSIYFWGILFYLNHMFVWKDVEKVGYDAEFVKGMMLPLKIF